VPFQYKDRILAPLICYEALFTDLVRSYIDEGADIIINPGNDGWFGEQGALSHLSLALLRTIEYRIPLIRVNNSGVSTVINHKGEILFDTLSSLNIKTGKVFNLEITNSKPTF
jgi:apolipoprotein N-acyltransferase